MELENKDIIQANATIIAGVLILFTLSNVAGDPSHVKNVVGLAAYTVIPFSISAILILFLDLPLIKVER